MSLKNLSDAQLDAMSAVYQKAVYQKAKAEEAGWSVGNELGRRRILCMRLRLKEYEALPFEHVSTAMTDDKVIVFLVVRGKPVVIEDSLDLFPSDTLITQLKVLQG